MRKDKKLKKIFTIKRIVYSSLFIALSVAANSLDITAGTMSLTLTYSFAFISSIFMGPLSGGLIAGLGDLLGAIIKGFIPNPIILLGSFVMGLIPGLLFKIKYANKYFLIALGYFLVFVICTCIINTTAFFVYFNKTGKTFLTILILRMTTQSIVVAVNILVTYTLYVFLSKTVFKNSFFTYRNVRYRMPMSAKSVSAHNSEVF